MEEEKRIPETVPFSHPIGVRYKVPEIEIKKPKYKEVSDGKENRPTD